MCVLGLCARAGGSPKGATPPGAPAVPVAVTGMWLGQSPFTHTLQMHAGFLRAGYTGQSCCNSPTRPRAHPLGADGLSCAFASSRKRARTPPLQRGRERGPRGCLVSSTGSGHRPPGPSAPLPPRVPRKRCRGRTRRPHLSPKVTRPRRPCPLHRCSGQGQARVRGTSVCLNPAQRT